MPIYNTTVDIYVKSVPITDGRQISCSGTNWPGRPCKERAIKEIKIGKHCLPTCDDEDHVENARLIVGGAWIEEMMDLYGDVPERKLK